MHGVCTYIPGVCVVREADTEDTHYGLKGY